LTRPASTESALWFAAAAGMAGVAVGGLAGCWWTLSGTVIFWSALLVLWWRDSERHPWETGLVLLLTLCYWGTFLLSRDLVQVSDYILNSDTARYLEEARALTAQPRHAGFVVITFPLVCLSKLGQSFAGWPWLGREAIYLQCSLAGALAMAMMFRVLIRASVERLTALTTSTAFGFSLVIWAISSVVETFILSVLLLLFLIVELRRFMRTGSGIHMMNAALISFLALGISLENIYHLVLYMFTLAWRVAWMREGVRWSHAVIYPLVAVGGVLALIWVQSAMIGPGYWRTPWGDRLHNAPATNLVEHLDHFATPYGGFALRGPSSWSGTAYRSFVAAIIAQPTQKPMTYGVRLDSRQALGGSNVPYLLLLAILTVTAMIGFREQIRRVQGTGFLVALLLLVVLVRHFAMAGFAPRQGVLFSPPSILALWMLLALGISGFSAARGTRRIARLGPVALLIMVTLLFVTNLFYVFRMHLP
jgi:hypothetical protein